VEDPPELVYEAEEREVAGALARVRLQKLRLATKVQLILTLDLVLDVL